MMINQENADFYKKLEINEKHGYGVLLKQLLDTDLRQVESKEAEALLLKLYARNFIEINSGNRIQPTKLGQDFLRLYIEEFPVTDVFN